MIFPSLWLSFFSSLSLKNNRPEALSLSLHLGPTIPATSPGHFTPQLRHHHLRLHPRSTPLHAKQQLRRRQPKQTRWQQQPHHLPAPFPATTGDHFRRNLDQKNHHDILYTQGDLDEQGKIISVLRQVDVVISALAYPQVLDQLKIMEAIKVAGNIKRFFPSDFGAEEDRVTPLPPFEAFLDKKRKIRRATEAAGIPHTFVSANCFGAYFVNYLLHPHEKTQDIAVYGSGEAKTVMNYEEDIAKYTIKSADDPRTCNRVVIYRPQKNIVSQLELISLWEKKTGKTFNRIHVPEEEIVELSKTLPHPQNIPPSILHSLFIKGDLMSFELGEDELEASTLYPDLQFKTIDQLLDIFLINPPDPAMAAFE